MANIYQWVGPRILSPVFQGFNRSIIASGARIVTPCTASRRSSFLILRLLLLFLLASRAQPFSAVLKSHLNAGRLQASTEYFMFEKVLIFRMWATRVCSSFLFISQMIRIKSFLTIGVIWIVIIGIHIVHARRREWVSIRYSIMICFSAKKFLAKISSHVDQWSILSCESYHLSSGHSWLIRSPNFFNFYILFVQRNIWNIWKHSNLISRSLDLRTSLRSIIMRWKWT